MAKKYFQLDQLAGNPLNVRDETDGFEMVQSLQDDGLKKPLIVAVLEDAGFLGIESPANVVADGNRRLDALIRFNDIDPETFGKRFPKGIECEVHHNLSPEEFWTLVKEASDGKALTGNAEFFRLYRAMKVAEPNMNHARFCDIFGGTLPVTAKRRLQLKELDAKYKAANTNMERAAIAVERRKAVQDAHKGVFQTWEAVECNPLVAAVYIWQESGSQECIVPEDCRCQITQAGAKSTSTALAKRWSEIILANPDAEPEEILPEMRRLRKEQIEAKEGRDTTPWAAIAKTVAREDPNLWAKCITCYETAQLREAAEKAAKKAEKAEAEKAAAESLQKLLERK